MKNRNHLLTLAVAGILSAGADSANALTISRLTPPSNPISPTATTLSRFIPGQKFDLQATVSPDTGTSITKVEFFVDGVSVGVANAAPSAGVKTSLVTTGLASKLSTGINTPAGTAVASVRGYSNLKPGLIPILIR